MVAAVIDRYRRRRWLLTLAMLLSCCLPLSAAVLPEDRVDALYHSYEGGGIEINGPSVLVRKSIGKSTSLSANYYVDAITSASIDVVTSASPYTEKRTEHSLGADFMHEKSTLSLGYTTSEENDFLARTVNFGISQDVFGDLTTISLGYARGWDEVGMTGSPTFSENVERRNFKLGVSQILSKNLVVDLGYETITDEGFLNNPYREVRYVSAACEPKEPYCKQPEVYPHTRTSNAVALRGMYYLPYRASVHADLRAFNDTWGITAYTAKLGYTHTYQDAWIFDFTFRHYQQQHASFYSDLFPYYNAQEFLARDKELSTFSSQDLGLGVTYQFARGGWGFIDKGTLNFSYHRMWFDYEDFRDLRAKCMPAGCEPLYGFSADVMQFYISLWY